MMKRIKSIRGALMVWLISYLFFLATLANNFSASHDSINYLLGIVAGQHLFHQHHLFYNFLAHEWLVLLRPMLPGVSEHYIVESFTALWGSSTLAVCYLFFRNRFYLSRTLAARIGRAETCSFAQLGHTFSPGEHLVWLSGALLDIYKQEASEYFESDITVCCGGPFNYRRRLFCDRLVC
jgi:hypothetical protein